MEECFWKNGINFSCTRCSACCRYDSGYVFVSSSDLKAMIDSLHISEKEFINTYCRWVDFHDGLEYLSLIEKDNNDCIFWKKDIGCAIYKVRPLQCSAYPFWPHSLQSLDAWRATTRDCPAEKRITVPDTKRTDYYSAADIAQLRNQQLHNQTITRKRGSK